jgi:zinc protease
MTSKPFGRTRKRLGLGALAALLLAPLAAAAQGAGSQGAGARPVEFTASGIQVILKQTPANEVVAVRLYLRGGSPAQTAETAGIERLIVNLATRGTEEYTKEDFASHSTATGTQIGGEVTFDFTVFTGQAVRQHWNEAWDLFTQAALHPTFPEAEVAQVKAQMLNSLRQRRDDPDALLTLLSDSVLYAGSAFAVDPLGTPAAVERIARADLVRWHASRMTKGNLLLVVVGNVPRADLERKIASAFGSLPATGGAAPRSTLPPAARADALISARELPTNYIAGIFRAPNPGDPDYAATRVALYILNNRLFEEVRTKRNLTYAVSAAMAARGANYGRLYVTAVQPDTTLKVILAEARRLQQEPVTAKQLAENVNVLATSYWTGQLTNMCQATQLGTFELLGRGWEDAVDFVDALRKVTPQDVQRVSQRYLRDGRFVVVGDAAKIDRTLFSSW